MKTEIYVWWIKLQANHMPWTKLYKYKVSEWERMRSTHNFLKSFWCEGHKGNLEQKTDWDTVKKMVGELDE
jgi:hypothetical protein